MRTIRIILAAMGAAFALLAIVGGYTYCFTHSRDVGDAAILSAFVAFFATIFLALLEDFR